MISVKEAQKISEKAKPELMKGELTELMDDVEKGIKRRAGKGFKDYTYYAKKVESADALSIELEKLGYVCSLQGNMLNVGW